MTSQGVMRAGNSGLSSHSVKLSKFKVSCHDHTKTSIPCMHQTLPCDVIMHKVNGIIPVLITVFRYTGITLL